MKSWKEMKSQINQSSGGLEKILENLLTTNDGEEV